MRSHINLAMNICVSAIEIMIVIALYMWAALGDIAVIATILSLPGHELRISLQIFVISIHFIGVIELFHFPV